MSDIARSVTLDVCSHCGEIAGAGSHGHSDAPDWRWLRVEYVPVSQLDGAVSEVEQLRLWINTTGRGCPSNGSVDAVLERSKSRFPPSSGGR